ncbi:DUF4304 domain-containing protein [Blastopirellula sp. JC732]|uniref:DUF4304 domain-containing protein n=1 Tax=Blastopirellula sediminis TaxID=2894196 RepID=A0A9X1MNU9_9BACT|nr:DUF4304 domain-containing protein [Blastopirellula sediminis]MCC9608314.1 DUF4304 domain-containing protein [Blastopirellula sediminis]MCC9628909.1 DUF4304 domain-containing protein [Blastopirellula sediminis]
MSASKKKQFERLLLERLTPILSDDGFVGNDLKWIRNVDPVINCIEVQSRSDSKACCVNLGVHLTFLPNATGSLIVDIQSYSSVDCEIRGRLTSQAEGDQWWEYEMLEPAIDDLIDSYLDHGQNFFERFAKFPHPFVDIGPDSLDDDVVSSLFPVMTKVRMVLLLARVHDFLGNSALAKQFGQIGIDLIGGGMGPKAAFRKILRSHTT